jgi:hypothetical protein
LKPANRLNKPAPCILKELVIDRTDHRAIEPTVIRVCQNLAYYPRLSAVKKSNHQETGILFNSDHYNVAIALKKCL